MNRQDIDLIFGPNIKHINCGEDRIHFSKQFYLTLLKENNIATQEEINELEEYNDREKRE